MNAVDILNILFNTFPKFSSFPEISEKLFEGYELAVFEKQNIPPFCFNCISPNCCREYEQLSPYDKTQYISDSYKIFYPISTVTEIIKYTKRFRFNNGVILYDDTFLKTKNAVGNLKKDNADNLLILFSFLHEIGHCEHFISVGKKPEMVLRNIVEEEAYADDFAQRWLHILSWEQIQRNNLLI